MDPAPLEFRIFGRVARMSSNAVEIINVTHHHVHPHPFESLEPERARRVERNGAGGGDAAEHSLCRGRRLVVPACRRIRRPGCFDAGIRPHRPRRRAVPERLHGRAIVHAVACRAPHRSGGASPCRGRQPARVSSRAIRRVSGHPRRGRLSRGLHGKGLGTRSVRARRAFAQSGRTPVQAVRRIPGEAPPRAAVCLLVRQQRSPSAVRSGLRREGGLARRQSRRSRVFSRHAGSALRSARLPPRSATVRLAGCRPHRGARESRRARQHHRRGDVRQRHALSPRQGEPVRRGHSHAPRDPVAAEDPGRHEGPAVRRPCRYRADASRSGGPCHSPRR